jgi:hypothetical protein
MIETIFIWAISYLTIGFVLFAGLAIYFSAAGATKDRIAGAFLIAFGWPFFLVAIALEGKQRKEQRKMAGESEDK